MENKINNTEIEAKLKKLEKCLDSLEISGILYVEGYGIVTRFVNELSKIAVIDQAQSEIIKRNIEKEFEAKQIIQNSIEKAKSKQIKSVSYTG